MVDDALLPILVQHKSQVILQRRLWIQLTVTHICIVEVVEGRHAEAFLSEGLHCQQLGFERIDIYKECWRQCAAR
ncbi:Uncharacterised protein [Segatella copri]|nr:Uncharacterised protein [Segatella copri]